MFLNFTPQFCSKVPWRLFIADLGYTYETEVGRKSSLTSPFIWCCGQLIILDNFSMTTYNIYQLFWYRKYNSSLYQAWIDTQVLSVILCKHVKCYNLNKIAECYARLLGNQSHCVQYVSLRNTYKLQHFYTLFILFLNT